MDSKTSEFAVPINKYGEESARTGKNYAGVSFYGYRGRLPRLIFDGIEVEGMKPNQNKYVLKSIRIKNDSVGPDDIESEYIKVSSDDKIKSLYPAANLNKETQKFILNLKAKRSNIRFKNNFVFQSFGL